MNGVVVHYNEEDEYGFIRSSELDEDVFFHSSDLPEETSPSVGQWASFDCKRTSKGLAVVDVEMGEMEKSPFYKYGLGALIIFMVGFLALAFWGLSEIAAYFVSVNVTTFVIYAVDKGVAGGDGLRVPEKLLHILACAGGSPAAFLGQRLLRHKTRKKAFLRVYWLIVIGQIVIIYFLS